MKTQDGRFVARAPDPFGDSAKTRLVHMGVSDGEGWISQNVVRMISELFAGLFFDDVRDLGDEPRKPAEICETLHEMLKNDDWRRAYLFISLLYDRMRKPLPDPVWWLAGNPEAVKAFTAHFAAGLKRLISQNKDADDERKEEQNAAVLCRAE